MKEHEPGKMPSAPEIRQMLLGYLKDVEFGTPKYTALGDVLHLRELELTLRENQQAAKECDESFESVVWEVSNLRLTETEIALMRFRIHDHSVTMAGYHNAYMNFVDAIDIFEAKSKRDDGDIFDDLQEVYYSKQTGEVLKT